MSRTRKTPRRIRSDGWTLPRRRLFVKMCALTGSVDTAAAHASMSTSSTSSAYRLHLHPDGGAFRVAWDAALAACTSTLREIAFERAINGTRVPIMENGVVVGNQSVFNDRLLMFRLRRYDRERARTPQQQLLDTELVSVKPLNLHPYRQPGAMQQNLALPSLVPGGRTQSPVDPGAAPAAW